MTPEDDISTAKMVEMLYPEVVVKMRAMIDPNGDGVATKHELLACTSARVEEFLRSDEGRQLSDTDRMNSAVDTLKNVSNFFRKALGSHAPVIEDISDDEAITAAKDILRRVDRKRARNA